MIPLIFEEPASPVMKELLMEDTGMVVWWETWVECSVTVSRLRREEILDDSSQDETRATLDRLSANWQEIEPTVGLRLLTMLISKAHPLKAADCLQLTAALRWCEGDPDGTGLVCLDNQLRQAAEVEGFQMLPEDVQL